MKTLGAIQALDLGGHIDIGGLARSVSKQAVVVSFPVDVVQRNRAVAMGCRGNAIHARGKVRRGACGFQKGVF